MDAREWVLTKHLKAHDGELFCRRAGLAGPYCVWRKAVRWESHGMPDGSIIHYSRPSKHFCFALTDDWQFAGKPRDWGIEPVIQKAKRSHYSRADQEFEELLKHNESVQESKNRDLSSKTEDFLKDFRRPFAQAFNHVNTSTLEKIDLRRKRNGHYK